MFTRKSNSNSLFREKTFFEIDDATELFRLLLPRKFPISVRILIYRIEFFDKGSIEAQSEGLLAKRSGRQSPCRKMKETRSPMRTRGKKGGKKDRKKKETSNCRGRAYFQTVSMLLGR